MVFKHTHKNNQTKDKSAPKKKQKTMFDWLAKKNTYINNQKQTEMIDIYRCRRSLFFRGLIQQKTKRETLRKHNT